MSAALVDRIAEERIVGALLLDPALLPEVTEHVGPADLETPQARAAFAAIARVCAAGHDADVDLVAQDMQGDLSQSRAYLVETLDAIPSPANLVVHLERVRDLATRRRLRSTLANLDQELRTDGDLGEVRVAAREALEAIDVRSPDAGLRWRSVRELGGETSGADWLVEGLLAVGAVTVLAAKPKAGKTTFVAAMLAALERGQDVAGFPTTPATTVYLSEESGGLVRERCERFGVERAVFLCREDHRAGLPYHELLGAAADEAERRGATILVVDTFSKFAALERDGEKDAGAVQGAMDAALSVAGRGVSVLLVHHLRKAGGAEGDALRGSGALAGAADIIVELRRTEEDSDFRTLSSLSRYRETPTEPVVVRLAGARYVREGSPAEIRQGAAHRRVRDALEQAKTPLCREDALESAGGKRADNAVALAAMVEAREVVRTGKGCKGNPYLYSLPTNSRPCPSHSRPDAGDEQATEILFSRPLPLGGDGENMNRIRGAAETHPGPGDGDRNRSASR